MATRSVRITTFADLSDGSSYSGTSTGTLAVAATTTAMSGDQFRLVANVNGSTVNSNAATLTVAAAPAPPSSPPPSGGGGGGGGGFIDTLLLAILIGMALRRSTMRA